MKSILLGLALLLAACNRPAPSPAAALTSTEASRAPTEQEIEQYVKKKAKADRAAAKVKEQQEEHRAAIQREIDDLQGYITIKELEIGREQTRLLRRYRNDQIVEWTANIGKAKRRIAILEDVLSRGTPQEIEKELGNDVGFNTHELAKPTIMNQGEGHGVGDSPVPGRRAGQ